MNAIWRLMRPAHWMKNSFVLAGPFFAGNLSLPNLWVHAALTLLAFCFCASAVYAVNDALDVEWDRRHIRKCLRPVAAGEISPRTAFMLGAILAGLGLGLGFIAGMQALVTLGAYLVLQILYSRWLKHVVLLDVFCIAAGFGLRLIAGTWGLGIPPSDWFLLCGFLLSLFLGFSKRYAERIAIDPNDSLPQNQSLETALAREVMQEYTPPFLRTLLGASLGCTLMSYALYTVSPRTAALHPDSPMLLTVPVVAFGLCRYLFLVIVKGFGEDTAAEVLRDRPLLWACAVYAVLTGYFLIA